MKNNYERISMKELPDMERPYEKCLEHGPSVLSNAELLAVILKSGTAKETSVELATRLIKTFDRGHSLADVFNAEITELMDISGIGKVKAISLKCIGELCMRVSREKATNLITLSSASSIADFYMEKLRHKEQEEIRAALFDTKNHLIKDISVSTGTVNMSLITPRELFIKALSYKAVCLVLVHNHPSGDPKPSDDDLLITTRIKDSGRLLNITLLDHIIIGDNKYYSMKEQGIL